MLYDRLKQIRQAQKAKPPAAPEGEHFPDSEQHTDAAQLPEKVRFPGARRSSTAGPAAPAGAGLDPASAPGSAATPGPEWELLDDMVYHRSVRHEGDQAARLFDLYRRRSTETIAVVPPAVAPEQLVFFDLETTGLSSGAGSVAFLAGFGRLDGAGVVVEQLFLADYPGEPAFLAAVRDRIGPEDVIVSYNGRSFDAQVLKTRLLMNGMSEIHAAHADLLHPARRLWKRLLPDCSLGTIEASVLGVRRELDLPGWEVPEAYFDYLRHGVTERLDAVFAHHEQDILSLADLLERLESFVGEEAVATPVDRFELGRFLTRPRCDGAALDRGRRVLHELLLPNHPDALRAALYLGTWYRRQGLLSDAEGVWHFAFRELKSVDAAVALAKLHEHRDRDPFRAIEVVATAMGWPHARPYAESLRYRRARLERKLARRNGVAGSAVE